MTTEHEFPPVEALLPHSHPMILVDQVLAFDGDHATAKVCIRPDSPLVEGDKVPALVAIEYMAQSIGLLTGCESYNKNAPVQVGYLLGTRSLTLAVDHFSVGDVLTVQVNRLFGEDELGSFTCQVLKGDQLMAEATLNVYRNKDHVLPGRGVSSPQASS